MKKNTANKLLMLCCLLAMISCKARKQIIATPITAAPVKSKPVENTLAAKLAEIRGKQVVFSTFSGRASTKLNIDNNDYGVTLTIRINRDKEIWVSVTAILNYEVARAVITPDSILIMNKLQGLYIKKPFSYINTYASKQVNYKTIESLLVGNAVPEFLNEKTNLQADNGNITLSGNLANLMYQLMLGPDMKVTHLGLSNQSEGQSLEVNNSDFIQAVNRTVPSQINIASVVKDKKMQVNLHYTKVDFDQQLEYPFNIPESYKDMLQPNKN